MKGAWEGLKVPQGFKGHKWFTNDYDGGVDEFRVDVGYHNGPECEACGLSFCMHCTGPDDIEECPNATKPTTEGGTSSKGALAESHLQATQQSDPIGSETTVFSGDMRGAA